MIKTEERNRSSKFEHRPVSRNTTTGVNPFHPAGAGTDLKNQTTPFIANIVTICPVSNPC